jgi:cephalosporin hydroxylase
MRSELRRAGSILSEEGWELTRRATRYVRDRYRDPHVWARLLRRDEALRAASRDAIDRRMAQEATLADILDTVLEIRPGVYHYQLEAYQFRAEFAEFCDFLDGTDPETVLEIGTHYGGSLYVWSRFLDSASTVVSVDRPHVFEFVETWQRELYPTFAPSKTTRLVRGNSHDTAVLDAVAAAVDEVDLLFIDGDHTYRGVHQDFAEYGELVADDGVVAVHDIVPHVASDAAARRYATEHGIEDRYVSVGQPSWGVSEFWTDIAPSYETREFRSHPRQRGKGIGVVRF